MLPRIMFAILACALPAQAQAPVDYQRDIRPILAKRCIACHGPDEHGRQANFRLDTRDGATGKSGGYAGIVPGNSAKSRVYARITNSTRPMPPVGPRLSSQEVDLIRQWIDSGAPYTNHWAFEKPQRLAPPAVSDPKWPAVEFDYFVLARLDKEGLRPSPIADRYTLARRVALDLTGLPPSPEMTGAYLKDTSPEAYERLVDKLLASPQYGERWARVWLDLARYADTQGYEKDNRRTIWPYRDWVIRALNSNIPFDTFTKLQLAGDLMAQASEDDLIATGFHRNTMTNTEGGTDDEEFRDAAIRDRVAVTGQVWMGLTLGCAQCHTHKYDPISHKEFYQFYAFFNQTEDSDKPDDRPTLELANASTLVLKELPENQRRKTHILERGNFLTPGEEVEANVPAAFAAFPKGAPKNRLGLAEWLVSKENPLTARVTVNRIWARLFGKGIVESEEDFGTQGATPTNQELLDWLATEYMRLNWDTKAILKTIVMSATYRQSSNATPELLEKDPTNRVLARGARFRLDAEVVRDQALAVSGLLSKKMYGPPVMPWQPEGVWQVVYNGERWITSEGEDRYRRGLYTFMRRTSPYPSSMSYDAPTGEICTMRRIRTNTPLQALTSLNDPVFMEAAQQLALRTFREAGKSENARAAHMFQLALVRPPEKEELRRIVSLHREAWKDLKGNSAPAEKLLHYDKTLYKEDREQTVVADARGEGVIWRYTTEDPGSGWLSPGFDDSGWRTGKGLFGAFENEKNQKEVATSWETDTLWLRYEFTAPESKLSDFRLQVKTVSGFEAWINGVSAAGSPQERTGYYEYPVSSAAEPAIKPGRNVLAIRVVRNHEKKGGQSFDAGLVATRAPDFGKRARDDADRAAWVAVANAILNLDETLTRR